MLDLLEKRTTERINHVSPVRYSIDGQKESRAAVMYNLSNSGLYMELKFPPPKLGANLLIEVLEYDLEDDTWLPSPRRKAQTCYYAKVVWKKNLPDSPTADYGIGLCYLQTSTLSPE